MATDTPAPLIVKQLAETLRTVAPPGIDPPHENTLRSVNLIATEVAPALDWQAGRLEGNPQTHGHRT